MNGNKRIVQVGINGFGVMGRLIYRLLDKHPLIDVVKINDLAPKSTLDYLLKYDSVHGRFDKGLENIEYSSESNPKNIFWQGVDIVVDSTPDLKTYEHLSKHLEQGAEYVIRTSPLGGNLEKTQTIIQGVNDNSLDLDNYRILSLASCTTNCLAPLVKLVKEFCQKTRNSVEDLDFVTVHAYTNDQAIKDSAHSSDLRRGRDVNNIIETGTGASSQIELFFPELKGKIFGTAYRVPVSDGSVLELRVKTRNGFSLEQFNNFVKLASENDLKNILRYETLPLVSSDCIDDAHTCIYLESAAQQLSNNKVKLGALYDNEFGYSSKIVDLIKLIEQKKFDPIRTTFEGYRTEMTVEAEGPYGPDCDDWDELNYQDVVKCLKNLETKNNWKFEENKTGKAQGDGTLYTNRGMYKIKIGWSGKYVTLLDQKGDTMDLSGDRKNHDFVRGEIGNEFHKELQKREIEYTDEDREWDEAMEMSPDDHE